MRFAIVTRRGDRFAAALAAQLEAHGAPPALLLDSALDGADMFSIDASGVYWQGHAISHFDGVLVRGQRYQYPVVPRADEEVDFSLWQTDYLAQQQRYSALSSALFELERRGVRVLNPLRALQADFVKPALLARLSAAGFVTPGWLCSNDVDEVRAFRARHPQLRWRPVTGRGAWQRFEQRQQDDLVAPGKPPILLADSTGEALVRTYVCRSQALLSLRVEPAAFVALETLERFSPAPCPLSGAELERLCAELGMHWLQLSFMGDADGLRLCDVDADPRPEELPETWLHELTSNLAAALCEKQFTALSSGQAIERKALFLRRMLQMLFEMEASKYQ